MYANFYYQRSTKKYGRGPWFHDVSRLPVNEEDRLELNADFLYIGEVYDQELFKNSELTP